MKPAPGPDIQDSGERSRIMEDIKEALPGMSPMNRKIALYMLEDAQNVGFASIHALSRAIGVSEASVVRFTRTLGYSGYFDFKKEVQRALKQQSNPYGDFSGSELTQIDAARRFQRVVRYESENIRKTFHDLDLRTINTMIDGLRQAENIFICGFGSARHVVELFGFLMTSNAGKRVISVTGSVTDYIHKLSLFTPKDVAIIVTLPLYCREDHHIAKFLKERGGQVYLFTDSPRCPIYPIVDQAVLCANKSFHYTNSYSGLIASFKVLMDMWLLSDKDAFTRRMKSQTDSELECYNKEKI